MRSSADAPESQPASTQSPRPARRTWLYGLVLLVLLALVIEGGARLLQVLLPKSLGLAVPPHISQLDPELGWTLRPNSSGVSKRTGDVIRYDINSHGLRDDETSWEKPADTTRILLLGDSRTFGFGVPIRKHFSMLIEGYQKQLECINMGVDGYGIDQELLVLRKYGFRYHPDVVMALVSHFGDERHLHDSRWGMGKPVFVLESNGTLTLKNSPVTNNSSWYTTLRELDRMASFSMAYSMFRDVLLHAAHRFRPPATPAIAAPAPPAAPPAAASASEIPAASDIPAGFTEAEWAHQKRLYGTAMAILQAMDQDCKAHGATFVLLTQMPELHGLAELYGIRSLNVFDAMRNDLFPLPDGLAHFNEAGNGVLAWEVVQYLRREGLIPQP